MAKKESGTEEKSVPVAEKSVKSNQIDISVNMYLKGLGKKPYELGGLIAFANKKSKKRHQTAEEWKEVFSKY